MTVSPRRCLAAAGFAAILLAAELAADPPVQSLALPGGAFATSAVALGDVDGDGLPDVVVGDSTGKVHVYRYAGGTLAFLRTLDTGTSLRVEGRPAIGDVDGDLEPEVVFGTSSIFNTGATGRMWVFDRDGGAAQCSFSTPGGAPCTSPATPGGVHSSPALADLDFNDGGRLEIVFGSWDRNLRALNHDCTVHWVRCIDDTVWSSPAIGDLDDDGDPDIVVGSDASNSQVTTPPGHDGGVVLAYDGLTGTPLTGFPYTLDEVVSSSPSLGDLTGGPELELAVGTGYCWARSGCATPTVPGAGDYLLAVDSTGLDLPAWPVGITGRHAFGSPALADLDADGELDLVFNSRERANLGQGDEIGRVHALRPNGTSLPGWPRQPVTPAGPGTTVSFGTDESPVVADVDGDGELNVILPSNTDLVIWDAAGTQLTRDAFPIPPGDWELVAAAAMTTPAIGDLDGDGDLEVVGASGQGDGRVYVWDFPPGAATGATPWPMFKANAHGTSSTASPPLFGDGFESGDTSRWSLTAG